MESKYPAPSTPEENVFDLAAEMRALSGATISESKMAGVNPCSAGHGPKETASAPQAGKAGACKGADEPEYLSRWDECEEACLEDEYSDDYGGGDMYSNERPDPFYQKEYGPVDELFTANWPVDTSNLFGLLLRLAEEPFLESKSDYFMRGFRPPWHEIRCRIWKALIKLRLPPFVVHELIMDAETYSYESYWGFHKRSGGRQFADNIYEAEHDRYLRGKKAGCQDKEGTGEPSDNSKSPQTGLNQEEN